MPREIVTSIAHTYVFDMEKNFDVLDAWVTIKRKWHLSLYWSVVYIAVVLSLERYMRHRPPFQLQTLLVLWNLSLTAISLFGLARVLPEFFYGLTVYSYPRIFCDISILTRLGGFWIWTYGFFKLIELCDTLFIVLRKRPLTYLHMIHHSLTLILTWYFASQEFAMAAWLALVNGIIHFFMYSYYAAKALRINIPEYISRTLTVLQMLQLFYGFFLPIPVLYILWNGGDCHATYSCCLLCSVMNGLYFILFLNYFYKTYIQKRKTKVLSLCKGQMGKQN